MLETSIRLSFFDKKMNFYKITSKFTLTTTTTMEGIEYTGTVIVPKGSLISTFSGIALQNHGFSTKGMNHTNRMVGPNAIVFRTDDLICEMDYTKKYDKNTTTYQYKFKVKYRPIKFNSVFPGENVNEVIRVLREIRQAQK